MFTVQSLAVRFFLPWDPSAIAIAALFLVHLLMATDGSSTKEARGCSSSASEVWEESSSLAVISAACPGLTVKLNCSISVLKKARVDGCFQLVECLQPSTCTRGRSCSDLREERISISVIVWIALDFLLGKMR